MSLATEVIEMLDLIEKRRSDQITDIVKLLDKYKDDPTIFISFTSIKKIGINPKSKYNTPIGIYTYPLELVWDDFVNQQLPFASDRSTVQVLKSKGKMLDNNYSTADLKHDIQKLKSIVHKNTGSSLLNISIEINKAKETAFNNSPFGLLWNITRLLSGFSKTKKGIISNPVVWNKLFRLLGYSGAVDDGKKIIHKNEPVQAVFFDVKSFTHIGEFVNKRETKKDTFVHSPKEVQDLIENGILGNRFLYLANAKWKGVVRIATGTRNFLSRNSVWFISGDWYSGTFSGMWVSGTFHNGTFEGTSWRRGTWLNGIWKGTGWATGKDKKGRVYKVSPDEWHKVIPEPPEVLGWNVYRVGDTFGYRLWFDKNGVTGVKAAFCAYILQVQFATSLIHGDKVKGKIILRDQFNSKSLFEESVVIDFKTLKSVLKKFLKKAQMVIKSNIGKENV